MKATEGACLNEIKWIGLTVVSKDHLSLICRWMHGVSEKQVLVFFYLGFCIGTDWYSKRKCTSISNLKFDISSANTFWTETLCLN